MVPRLLLLFVLCVILLSTGVPAAPTTVKHDAATKKDPYGGMFNLRTVFNASKPGFSMKKATSLVFLVCAVALALWFVVGSICCWCGERGLSSR